MKTTTKTSSAKRLITEHDIYFLREGTHYRLYDRLGAHVIKRAGAEGVNFAVWAPNARAVSVIGDFNGWNRDLHQLSVRDDSSGVWEGFVPRVAKGTAYKYYIRSGHGGYEVEKADPLAFRAEEPPKTASVVWTSITRGPMRIG